ncbi:programmed cell death protein 4-like [Styela clava]|uniref:programmed cell death protein 4-like n=1 Tax=Styela clava TaxID=7725 RepID=UPI00193A667B|nr:programmed cell death protein 4-like [Styela clava]
MDTDKKEGSGDAKVEVKMDAEAAKAKEKRRTRKDSSNSQNSRHSESGNGNGVSNGAVKRAGKIGDRKSRTIYGRGLPKKGGGGGKGTWGRPGEELLTDGVMDNKDPNYDSEEQDNDIMYKPVTPVWSEDEIIKTLQPIIKEYFEHGQQDEVHESVEGLNVSDRKYMVIVVLITLAMEKKNEFRELASLLLKRLVAPLSSKNDSGENASKIIYYANAEDLSHAFLDLCDSLPELVLDTPDAAKVLGRFLARAISEKIIEEKILSRIIEAASLNDDEYGKSCAKEARLLLSIPHYNLSHIWGVGGGNQPMILLKKKINLLLKEYLSSGDSEEAIRCITDLDVPHFNHEVVYEAIIMLIELSNERSANMMVHLFKRLADTVVVTADQLVHGFKRVYGEISDLSIDVPKAYPQLQNFVKKCHDLQIIDAKLMMSVPTKSRKRFVSEGDHGRFSGGKYGDRFFDLA